MNDIDFKFRAKQINIDTIKKMVTEEMRGGHPVKVVEGYKQIQTWAGEQAKKQEAANERDGVPE